MGREKGGDGQRTVRRSGSAFSCEKEGSPQAWIESMPPSLVGRVCSEEDEGEVEEVPRRELRGLREGMIHY